jgi:hypothetical protein
MRKAKTKSKVKSRVKYQSYTQTTFEFSSRSDVYKYLLEKVKKNKHITIVIGNNNVRTKYVKDILKERSIVDRIRYLTSDGNCDYTGYLYPPTKDNLRIYYVPSCFVEDFVMDFERKPTIKQTIKAMEDFDSNSRFNIDYISLDKGETWINIVVV